MCDPVFIKVIQSLQVIGGDAAFVITVAQGDAVEQGGNGRAQVDHQVGRGEVFSQGAVKRAVSGVIAFAQVALQKQVCAKTSASS